jgi:hypothetical protein
MLFGKSDIEVGIEITSGLQTFDLALVSLMLRRRKHIPKYNLSQNRVAVD